MNIPILLGTARKGNRSQLVAEFVLGQAQALGVDSQIVRPQDHLRSFATERVGKEFQGKSQWQTIMAKADGLIIVTPEYNHSFPGELKLMLDQLYQEFNRKPVGLVGVSDGATGGVRVVEMLYPVLIALEMKPLKQAVYFTNVPELINKDGKITDETYKERVAKFLEHLTNSLTL